MICRIFYTDTAKQLFYREKLFYTEKSFDSSSIVKLFSTILLTMLNWQREQKSSLGVHKETFKKCTVYLQYFWLRKQNGTENN